MAEGVTPLPDPASGQSIEPRASVGDWPCVCGQRYRVLTEPLTFWPRNSAVGYLAVSVVECVACGIELEDRFALEAALLVAASVLA